MNRASAKTQSPPSIRKPASSLSLIAVLGGARRKKRRVTEQRHKHPERAMNFLNHLEERLIAFLMGAATLLIFVAVLHRYAAGVAIPGVQDALLKIDLSWAQELCIYMFVWMAKFGRSE